MLEDNIPTWTLYKELHDRGYRKGDCPFQYMQGSPLFLGPDGTDFVTRRAFLQCLVNLPLLQSRGLSALTSSASEGYYKCVLKAPRPDDIPSNAHLSDYAKMLQDIRGGSVEVLPLENGNGSGSEDSGAEALPVRKKLRIVHAGHSKLPPCSVPIRSRRLLAVTDHSDDPRSPSPGPPPSSDSDEGPSRGRVRRFTGVRLEGSSVLQEEHLEQGERGYYFRLSVNCHCATHRSLRNTKVKKCRKRHSVKLSLGRDGVIAALAYLGAWLEEGSRRGSREDHRDFRPSMPAQRTYKDAHGLSEWDVDMIKPRRM